MESWGHEVDVFVWDYLSEGQFGGINMQVFADGDYARKVTKRRLVSGGLVMCEAGVYLGFQERRSTFDGRGKCVALDDIINEVLILRREFTLYVANVWDAVQTFF